MGDLVESHDGGLPGAPTFTVLDPLLRNLLVVREAVILADAPSADLLSSVDHLIEVHAKCKKLFAYAIEPIPKAGAVAYLGLLLKAYPNAGSQDASTFGLFLRDDVMSLQPSFGAVEIACRRWRQRSKFLPAISEMMIEVKAARDELANAAEFVSRLPSIRKSLVDKLGK